VNEVLAFAGDALSRWAGSAVRSGALVNGLTALGLASVLLLVERHTRGDARRYWSRNARTDAVYMLVYLAGVYGVLVSAPVAWALGRLAPHAPFLESRLLDFPGLPPVARIAISVLVVDCAGYWIHRWLHASPTLWAFHRIHHSQERLTVFTSFRAHFGEIAVQSAIMIVVGRVLSPPLVVWAPLGILFNLVILLSHTGYDWHFGPLERLIVSPRHHSFHHSVELRHRDRNFGMTFSMWDHLFGTAVGGAPPRAFGLQGVSTPESFVRQLPLPLIELARAWQTRPPAGT
jgi:sterol desaturase/sphingolipid hydroxylase (fatty acid hydroxylase superfamily)